MQNYTDGNSTRMKSSKHYCLLAVLVVLGLHVLPQVASRPGPVKVHQFKRIVGGQEAESNWPWQGYLLKKRNVDYKLSCGVVLIHKQWVVTTTACVFDTEPWQLKVVLGDRVRSEKEGTEQEFQVSVMHVNPRFLTDKGYGYNIAILKLSSPATLTDAVKVIKLPNAGEPVPVGETCFMTGWGSTTNPRGKKSDTLQQAEMPVVSYEECKYNEKLGYTKVYDYSMFCAGYRGKKTLISGCNGDGGDAFACKKNGIWILQGIVSWGDSKCEGTYYSVMTRMSSFVVWINEQMETPPLQKPDSCIDTSFYCQEWKKKGWCRVEYYKMRLNEYYCKKTCNAC